MPENETLESVASDQELEQPTGETVESGTLTEAGVQPPANGEETTEETAPELLAGKYASVEELIKGYQNASSEASRLAAENAGFKKGVEAARGSKETPTEQQYTPEQLKSWKAGYLTSLSDSQAARRIALKDGDHETAAKYEQEAAKAANQLVLIDDKLRDLDTQRATRAGKQETASRTVEASAKEVLTKYESQLVQGNPLYAKAAELWQHYLDMGHPDNAVTQAQAVLMAAELTGAKPAGGAADARKTLTKSIQSALKKGVVAGAGKAKETNASTPDFLKMSDKEFTQYKRERGWN